MANTLKIKRGSNATTPQGQLAEPLFTTDTYDLYIGKGGALGNQRFQKYIASGTSSQFLKGDGTLDSTTYQPTSEKGQNNGYASLDAGGKIPAAQLPSSVIEYKGTWNASTNTPTLADGTGDTGDVYIVSVGGTQNLGSGAITFAAGDWVMYNGAIWEKSINSNAVASVNGQTGVVTITFDQLSPMTTLGDIIYGGASGAGTRLAGNTLASKRFLTQTGDGTNSAAPSWGSIAAGDVPDLSATYLPLAGGTLTGQIILKEGTNSTDYSKGLRFPNDPYGGSGDTSGLRLYADTGVGAEAQVLELYVTNDTPGVSQDRINFYAPNNDLVTINGNKIWNASNLVNPVTGTGSNNEIAFFNTTGSTIASLSTATYPSLTELSYVKGVTSAIQTQLNSKEPIVTKGNLTEATSSVLTITGGTGAVIGSGTTIAVASAGAAQAGVVTTGSQTFAGDKTFSGTTAAVNVNLSGDISVTDGNDIKFNGSSDLNWRIYRATTAGFNKTLALAATLNLNSHYGGLGEGFAIGAQGGNSYYEIKGSIGTTPEHFFRGYVGIGVVPTTDALTVFGAITTTNGGAITAAGTISSGSTISSGLNITAVSTISGSALIPTGTTAPTVGMYLVSGTSTLNGVLGFSTGATKRFEISTTGEAAFNNRVSVGNGLSTGFFSVTNATSGISASFSDNINNTLEISHNATGSKIDCNTVLLFSTASTTRMTITSLGAVGFAVTPAAQNSGTLAGSVEVGGILRIQSGGGRYFTTGDGMEISKTSIYSYNRTTSAYNTIGINDTMTIAGNNGATTVGGNFAANSPSAGNTGEGIIAGTSFKIDAGGTGQKAKMYVVSKDLSDTYGSGLQIQFANYDDNKGFGFNLNTSGNFELYGKTSANSWQRNISVLQNGNTRIHVLLSMEDNQLRWRAQSDSNHATVYDGTTNGPVQYGYQGAAMGYNPGSGNLAYTRVIWTSNNNYYNYGNTTTWNTTSDIRIKENIKPIESSLSTLLKLNPVSFDYKSEYANYMKWNDDYKLNNIGFIAQEWEKVFPDYMDVSKVKLGDKEIDDLKNIDTSVLMPLVIKAIQELNTKIDAK